MILYVLLGVIFFLLLITIWFLYRVLNNKNMSETFDDMYIYQEKLQDQLKNLKEELRENTRTLDHKLHEQQRDMNNNVKFQFTESQKLISDITDKLSKVNESVIEVKEGNKQVFNMTEQLTNLEKVLTNQKQRGNWGESSLELILSNIIGGHYKMQHRFENGEVVDAVVYIKEKLLPIDSKFSLDNYQRCVDAETEEDRKYFADEFKKDTKLRIAETAKYIREKEDTLPIAFMFIPSEAIYYDLLAGENSRLKVNTQKLIEYAQSQKVFIVSPTSILAYLHLVLSGIKAFKIEEGAKQIQKKVEELGKHMDAYEQYYIKLGNTLSTTVNHYNAGYKEMKKIDKDVYKITEGAGGGKMEPELLDKPIMEMD